LDLVASWLTAKEVLTGMRLTCSPWTSLKVHQPELFDVSLQKFRESWLPVLETRSVVRLGLHIRASQVRTALPPLPHVQVLLLVLEDDFTISSNCFWRWVQSLHLTTLCLLGHATLHFEQDGFDFSWTLEHLRVAHCTLSPSFDGVARLGPLASNPFVKDLGFDELDRDVFPSLGPGLETLRLTCMDEVNQVSLCEYIAARGQGLTTFEMGDVLSAAALAAFPRTLRHLDTVPGSS
jgi:hypothetical protein